MPMSSVVAFLVLVPTIIVLLVNYVALRLALRRLNRDPSDAVALDHVQRRRAWAWPLQVLTYLLLLLTFFLDRYAFFVLAAVLIALPLWRRGRIQTPRRYFMSAAIMVVIGVAWPFSSFRYVEPTAQAPGDEPTVQVAVSDPDRADGGGPASEASDLDASESSAAPESAPPAAGETEDSSVGGSTEVAEAGLDDPVVPAAAEVAAAAPSSSDATAPADAASANDPVKAPVVTAPPPPPPLAPEPAMVTFVIESHPVAAPIHVSTRAGDIETLRGTGSVALSVPVGTIVRYSIRPSSGSGYEPYSGRVTVEQAATHPVWLTPKPTITLPNLSNYGWDTPERTAAEWFANYAVENWDAMVAMSLPSQLRVQGGRERAFNTIEGTYFFREYRRLISIERVSSNNVSARVNVVWEHDLGRSSTTLTIIRENRFGDPDPREGWSVSYISAVAVRDVP